MNLLTYICVTRPQIIKALISQQLPTIIAGCFRCKNNVWFRGIWKHWYTPNLRKVPNKRIYRQPSNTRRTLVEYWIEHVALGLLCVMCTFPTSIFYRWVPGFATDCPCGVWCRGLTTCLHYFDNSHNLSSRNWIYFILRFLIFHIWQFFFICLGYCLGPNRWQAISTKSYETRWCH